MWSEKGLGRLSSALLGSRLWPTLWPRRGPQGSDWMSPDGDGQLAVVDRLLGPTRMTLGVDNQVRVLAGGQQPVGSELSVEFGPDGSVKVGEGFRQVKASWYQGPAAIGRAGTGLVIHDVFLFLDGSSSREKLARALDGLAVRWVGVRQECRGCRIAEVT